MNALRTTLPRRAAGFWFALFLSVALTWHPGAAARGAAPESPAAAAPDTAPDTAGSFEKLLDAAAGTSAGMSRAPLRTIEEAVAQSAADPVARAAIARGLAARLSSPTATVEARSFFCWQLSMVGSEEQVPAIVPLLTDTNLSYYARLALERIPGEQALAALRQALRTAPPSQRLGLVNSLAARADPSVIQDLIPLARDTDPAVARAALEALGRFGTPGALRALAEVGSNLPTSLEPALHQAQLACAASLVRSGQAREALGTLERLDSSTASPVTRAAALALLAATAGPEAEPKILAALTGADPGLRQAGLQALQSADDSALASAARSLDRMSPAVQISLLAILAQRGATNGVRGVMNALGHTDPSVRLAALAALARLGTVDTVAPLLARLPGSDARERAAVSDTLARLPDARVDATLLAALTNSVPEVQLASIRALRARASQPAVPAFLHLAAAGTPDVRREALRGLGQLANGDACPELIRLLGTAPPDALSEVESSLAEICRRSADPLPLIRALPQSRNAVRGALLNVLAAVGGREALGAIEREADAADPDLQLAALRLLAEWPDAAPLPKVGAITLAASDDRVRAVAARGLARLAPMAEPGAAAEAVETIRRALGRVGINEQRSLLAALGEIPGPASLQICAACLANPNLAAEARAATVRILERLPPAHRAEARPVVRQLAAAPTTTTEAARLDWFNLKFGDLPNLCLGATATNRDGLKPDGQGGPPAAAIDGDERTYWDEEDNQPLYVLRVVFPQASKLVCLRIVGWKQHDFAPRDFEILGDDRLLKKVENAQYTGNAFRLDLPGPVCRTLELRISGSHGPSPAIRELEVYGQPAHD